ncbi:MAG: hypothetical protein JXA52_00910 [Planctomycetes bacterium]|nr:hypothetical protein [Planctomycetota bacterium]
MNRLEEYIELFSKKLHVSPTDRERILDELRQHIEECKLEFFSQGHSEKKVEDLVLKRLGDAKEIIHNFDVIYKRGSLAFMLDLFHKEGIAMRRTVLKTIDWIATIIMGTLGFLAFWLPVIFVLPSLQGLDHEYNFKLELNLFPFVYKVREIVRFIEHVYWAPSIVGILLVGLIIWLFYKSKSKLKYEVLKTGLTLLSASLVIFGIFFLGCIGLIYFQIVMQLLLR